MAKSWNKVKPIKIDTKLLGWSDIMSFGKYSGRTIYAISQINPRYLLWCHFRLSNFKLQPVLVIHLQAATRIIIADDSDDYDQEITGWLHDLDGDGHDHDWQN